MVWLRRHAAGVLAALFGLATAAILAGRLDRSFDYDESVAIGSTISRGSAVSALTSTAVFNNHPIFAAVQSIWWGLGGQGEARQRLLPLLYGAAAVALLVWWVARRLGPLAGASAGAVLMLNPMFVGQARLIRGYSLVALGIVVATITLIDYVRAEASEPRSGRVWLLAVHAAAIVVAAGTHLFALVPLGAVGIGALLVLRRFDPRLWLTWLAAAVGTALVYLTTFDDLRRNAEERGTAFRPWFARAVSWEVLGRDRVTAVVVGAIAVVGLVALVTGALARRPGVRLAAIVVPLLVVAQAWVMWQVVQPFDLYPRFFLGVIPLIGLAVAIAVRWRPALAAVLALALLFTVGNVVDVRTTETPIRDVAAVVNAANGAGLRSCAVGGWPLLTYGAATTELDVGADDRRALLAACDVFVRIGSWGRPLVKPARAVFPYESRAPGGFHVFSVVPPAELGL